MLTALRIVKITLGATSVVLTLVKEKHRHDVQRIQIQNEATAVAAATVKERLKNGEYDNDGFNLIRILNDFEFERITYERPS